jgi:hypothetical protein
LTTKEGSVRSFFRPVDWQADRLTIRRNLLAEGEDACAAMPGRLLKLFLPDHQ